jgi:hypothetical protein
VKSGETSRKLGITGSIVLTSALVGGEWSASRPGHFTPEERTSGTHWIGGWVGPRTSLDDVETRKILLVPELVLRPLARPARSQSLYCLRCPGVMYPNSFSSLSHLNLRTTCSVPGPHYALNILLFDVLNITLTFCTHGPCFTPIYHK